MTDTSRAIPGLHHVTAIGGPPQAKLEFHARHLRQRLVKRTVSFDDPKPCHLGSGDLTAAPGSILAFFPFADAGPVHAGSDMASAVAYAVPRLDPWMDRMVAEAIGFQGPFATAAVPDVMGYAREAKKGATRAGTGGDRRRIRDRSREAAHASVVDRAALDARVPGGPGTGMIHHVAFRAHQPEDQRARRVRSRRSGLAEAA